MPLNFIDIASYQAGIDLDGVFKQNDLAGIIVKATEGMYYVNSHCDPWVQWLRKNGKLWGFYHFLNADNPTEEAKRFVKDCLNYFGEGVPCADYEGSIVQKYGTYYLRRFLETVYDETGVKCLVYCNLSTIQSDVNGFRQIAEAGFPLWLAQYASNKETLLGSSVWQKGSYAPFERITMHQYSDHGRLAGYSGYLDLDIFYGDSLEWKMLALPAYATPDPEPEPEPEPAPAEDWLDDWIEYEQAEADRHLAKVAELKRRKEARK